MRNFFEHQSKARTKSFVLFLYFLGAIAVVAATVSIALYALTAPFFIENYYKPFQFDWRTWDYGFIATIAYGVVGLIILGTLYKLIRLHSGGGALIAEMLGGQVLYPDTTDFYERRLLNIVEEMAIASGVTVPNVYILDKETGINAFVAGFTQEDAVLGVTWGTVHYLTREELQGVVAHEFSHILSGDMLINIRLQGMLHGILVLGLLGRSLIEGAFGSDDDTGGGTFWGFFVGLVLYVLGYIGYFVGRILKSAISRQREFLADASAVQFTRNPSGLAGALKKIGGLTDGSKIFNPRAAEISHMYFGNGVAESWFGLLNSHPPLLERVIRLDPDFKGTFPKDISQVPVGREEALVYTAMAGVSAAQPPSHVLRLQSAEVVQVPEDGLRLAMDTSGPVESGFGRELIDSIPKKVLQSARNAFGARAVVYGLLLDDKKPVRDKQLSALKQDADPQVWEELKRIFPAYKKLSPELRLPLVDFVVPALKTMSDQQYRVFRRNINTMMDIDGSVDLFEYALVSVLLKNLRPRFGKVRDKVIPVKSVSKVQHEISIVLSFLANYGHEEERMARKAFMRAVRIFDEKVRKYFIYQEASSIALKQFHESLKELSNTSKPMKENIVKAATECIVLDKKITVREAELLRVIAEALDRPVPPWLKLTK